MSLSKTPVRYKIPGKTFLLGEYAALFGESSLILTTAPYFEVTFTPGKGQHSFHPQSPAGLYFEQEQSFFSQWDVSFQDPYGFGGFGASTAQFIALQLHRTQWQQFQQEQFFSLKKEIALQCWKDYRLLHKNSEGLAPSGADLVAQITGELSHFRGRDEIQETLLWPFEAADILLFKTGQKIATHEHLNKSLRFQQAQALELRPLVEKAISAFQAKDLLAWIQAQKLFSQKLDSLGLQTPDVSASLSFLASQPGVLGVRACGALGADVIAVTLETEKREALMRDFENLQFVASLRRDQAYGTIVDIGEEQ